MIRPIVAAFNGWPAMTKRAGLRVLHSPARRRAASLAAMTDARTVPPPATPAPSVSRQVSALVRLVESPSARGALRILSLGAAAVPLAAALRDRGHEIVAPPADMAAASLNEIARSEPGSFDAALALGFVEHLRWDRWALQQIHRALREGGILLLGVPDLYSLRSLANPRYVAAKLAKVLPRAHPRGAAREAVRAYPAGRLRAMLERLGFEPRQWSGLAIRGATLASTWPPSHHLVLARAGEAAPAAQDPAADVRRFEAENRSFLALRDRWRRQHALTESAPRAFDPERHAGADVLVLAPHPDDEVIGPGGTLLRLVRAGAKVTVLQATDGSASASLDDAAPGVRETIRLDEAQAVANAAGFQPTIYWREDNRAFRMREELVQRLRGTLRELRPALIFTPFLADIHPDHQTLNRILAAALDAPARWEMSVVGYEVWSLVPANLWCDISATTPDLERLLWLYGTAMEADDFIHMCRTRNRYHARTLSGSARYAEAFFA